MKAHAQRLFTGVGVRAQFRHCLEAGTAALATGDLTSAEGKASGDENELSTPS